MQTEDLTHVLNLQFEICNLQSVFRMYPQPSLHSRLGLGGHFSSSFVLRHSFVIGYFDIRHSLTYGRWTPITASRTFSFGSSAAFAYCKALSPAVTPSEPLRKERRCNSDMAISPR